MNILLIWPHKGSFGFQPIGLALLSGALKKNGHKIKLFDTTTIDTGLEGDSVGGFAKNPFFKPVDYPVFEGAGKSLDFRKELVSILEEFEPDIVGLSILFDTVDIGHLASEIVKSWKRDIPVIWGNMFPSLMCGTILEDKNVDYVCVGEGIEAFIEFADLFSAGRSPMDVRNIAYRAKDGRIVKNPMRPLLQDLDTLPFLDFSIFDHRHRLKPIDGEIKKGADHIIAWGCVNKCTYCIHEPYRKLYSSCTGKYFRYYSVERIIDELKYLVREWDISFFKFHDADFCLKPYEYFARLAKRYREEINVPFAAMANAYNVTREKVALLKEMNCVSLTLAIESGNDYLRTQILKRKETKEELIRAFGFVNEAGIKTVSFNMIGLPFDTRETIMETVELNRTCGVKYPNVGFFFPLEGTESMDISVRNGFYKYGESRMNYFTMPSLTLPEISREELIALGARFVLYVKLPYVFYEYIRRSEKSDKVGMSLTEALNDILRKYVFENNGLWDERADEKDLIRTLEDIAQK
ncbi:MAG: B12-binding domain-containing radical SAM protein [Candidatus Omnitrophica bacterium]|nr:B12-binding domain-containing radical SAM protein [Candidatus Omnitrophota bacterium]